MPQYSTVGVKSRGIDETSVMSVFEKKKRNRTLDRHRFFSRLQQPGETLSQFWHALNGLADICDFGEITTILVLDMFILHMSNKKVQEKLCTEPKEPDQALDFDIAYEEGVKRQKGIKTSRWST